MAKQIHGMEAGRDTPVAVEEESGAKRTRSAWLVEHLRQELLDGAYPLGSRLNEVHLSGQLNVSRTPVRAALQTLAGEGLLHYVPNRGFIVRKFQLSEIVEAYEMRALAEGMAARLAAVRGLTEDARHTIERSLEDGDRALAAKGDRETQRAAYARNNEIFHSAIIEAAGSNLVHDVVRLCQRMPQASAHNVVAFDLADVRERHRAHHQIYAAILNQDAREAETLMRQHVISVQLSMIRSIAYRGDQRPR